MREEGCSGLGGDAGDAVEVDYCDAGGCPGCEEGSIKCEYLESVRRFLVALRRGVGEEGGWADRRQRGDVECRSVNRGQQRREEEQEEGDE